MEFFRYFFRTARLEHVVHKKSHTIVIFVRGILSESQKAFKLNGREGYFWNLLENVPVFSAFDIAMFSYGKIDTSFILELDSPINNLVRMAYEMNGYISEYKNRSGVRS